MTSLDPLLLVKLRRISSAETLLIALDFDGTLAHFTVDPTETRIVPAAETALRSLSALPGTDVALVSGRPAFDLLSFGPEGFPFSIIGSHGAEYITASPEAHATTLQNFESDFGAALVEPLSSEERETLRRLEQIFADIAAELPHAPFTVETKPVASVVHTRPVAPEHREEVVRRVSERVAAELPQLVYKPGDNILEYTIRVNHKGEALSMLLAQHQPARTLFAGDDLMDEPGFAVLKSEDIGIKCGPKETSAEFRVADPDEMAAALTALAQFRAENFAK